MTSAMTCLAFGGRVVRVQVPFTNTVVTDSAFFF